MCKAKEYVLGKIKAVLANCLYDRLSLLGLKRATVLIDLKSTNVRAS